ncbi:MAG: preprotein translocase subunit SecE [Anaerolineae bacterium]
MTVVKQDNRLVRYFKETRAELRKVHWPSRTEARNLTIIVLAVTFAMTVLLGVILDPLALWLFRGILVEKDTLRTVIGLVLAVGGVGAIVWAIRRQA